MNELLTSLYVACELVNEKYALKISDVYEIIKMQILLRYLTASLFWKGYQSSGKNHSCSQPS